MLVILERVPLLNRWRLFIWMVSMMRNVWDTKQLLLTTFWLQWGHSFINATSLSTSFQREMRWIPSLSSSFITLECLMINFLAEPCSSHHLLAQRPWPCCHKRDWRKCYSTMARSCYQADLWKIQWIPTQWLHTIVSYSSTHNTFHRYYQYFTLHCVHSIDIRPIKLLWKPTTYCIIRLCALWARCAQV